MSTIRRSEPMYSDRAAEYSRQNTSNRASAARAEVPSLGSLPRINAFLQAKIVKKGWIGLESAATEELNNPKDIHTFVRGHVDAAPMRHPELSAFAAKKQTVDWLYFLITDESERKLSPTLEHAWFTALSSARTRLR